MANISMTQHHAAFTIEMSLLPGQICEIIVLFDFKTTEKPAKTEPE